MNIRIIDVNVNWQKNQGIVNRLKVLNLFWFQEFVIRDVDKDLRRRVFSEYY